jgi:hypothetical protein
VLSSPGLTRHAGPIQQPSSFILLPNGRKKCLRRRGFSVTNLIMSLNVSLAQAQLTKRIDLTRLPVTQVDRSPKAAGIFLLVFACLWGGIPALVLVKAVASGTMQTGLWGLLLFAVIGIGIFIGGLALLASSTTTTLSREKVNVTKKSLFGTRQWIEPLSAFTGIRSRSEYHSGGKNSPSYTLHIIELLHPDPKKAVRLYESRLDVGARGIWEDACRTLNLPAVEGEGDNVVIRGVEDLDKSVKDLAREGKLQVDFDLSKAPPTGLTLRVDGAHLELSIHSRHASLWGPLIGLIVSGVFVYVGFFVKNAPFALGIIGGLFMLLMLGSGIWSLITTEQIRVAREEIHVRRQTPWGPTQGTRISTASVESVRIGRKDGQGLEGILLETDAGTTLVAENLPSDSLSWLKNCILKVISA